MPSVQLSRLREQITQLLGQVDRPEDFQHTLRDLLERHSEHAYRSGELVTPRSLLPSYRVPSLVYRQLERELSLACARIPDQLLRVADALWSDDHLEPRLLASLILGQLPSPYVDEVILRVKAWAKPTEDQVVLITLLDQAARTIPQSSPEKMFELIRSWLEDSRLSYRQMGLRTLEALIQDPTFENIPPVFRLLSPLVLAPSPLLMNHLHHCLLQLAQKSPGETAYFLHQVIGSSADATTARLIRRVLPAFADSFQENLRAALRNRNKSS